MQPTFIIDFDSTIITCESLDELARLALRTRADRDQVLGKLQEITNQGMAGELPFDESLRRRLQMFAATREHIQRLGVQLQTKVTPSVSRNRVWFSANAERMYIISGGFEEYIRPVVARLGIAADHILANAFEFGADGAISGHDTSRNLAKASGKVRQVAALELPRPIIVIGDGYTDYEIRAAGEADEFWAFCENVFRPNVTAHADRIVRSFDEITERAKITVQ